jgi:hypothetical protein
VTLSTYLPYVSAGLGALPTTIETAFTAAGAGGAALLRGGLFTLMGALLLPTQRSA